MFAQNRHEPWQHPYHSAAGPLAPIDCALPGDGLGFSRESHQTSELGAAVLGTSGPGDTPVFRVRGLPTLTDSREHAAFLGLRAVVSVALRRKPPVRAGDRARGSGESRLSFSNLTAAHVLDALRRQYPVELPQIRRAVDYLREHFRTRILWFITRCSRMASTYSLKLLASRM